MWLRFFKVRFHDLAAKWSCSREACMFSMVALKDVTGTPPGPRIAMRLLLCLTGLQAGMTRKKNNETDKYQNPAQCAVRLYRFGVIAVVWRDGLLPYPDLTPGIHGGTGGGQSGPPVQQLAQIAVELR